MENYQHFCQKQIGMRISHPQKTFCEASGVYRGLNVIDVEDFLVSNILLPVGSLLFVLFCTCRYGWGWKNFVAEANIGEGAKVKNWMRLYMTYVLPLIVLAILVIGLVNFFGA